MGCVIKNPSLFILAILILVGSKLSTAELSINTTAEDKTETSGEPFRPSPVDPSESIEDAGEVVEISDSNYTLIYSSGVEPSDEYESLDDGNSTLQYHPHINDSLIDDFIKVLESQQVSVVADAELKPQETSHADYGHHKGHKSGHHKGSSHKGEKGYEGEIGTKGIHTESHEGAQKAGHHKEAGKKYKGKDHKHQHFFKEADGAKGHKGHHQHTKGHHHKGDKAKGHKNIWHKEESGRSKKFFDDYEHKTYHKKYDDLDLHHKSADTTGYKGALVKGAKHHDSYGKKASQDKGQHHDIKKKEEKSYGHKGHFGEHSKYDKKGAHKTAHADGHGGHGGHGDDGHHGAHSIQNSVQAKILQNGDENYVGSDSVAVPTKENALHEFTKKNIVPISIFVRQDDYDEKFKNPSKEVQGNYGGYLENSTLKDKKYENSELEEENEISDLKEKSSKFEPKRSKKVRTKVNKPVINNQPFIVKKNEEKLNESEEEREDERPSASSSFINIPILQADKTQQVSVITEAELQPEETGKGYSKSAGQKKSLSKASGEKGEKGGKKVTGFKGHHDGDHHEKHLSNFVDKGAKDFHADDHKKKYDGAHHTGKKGKKGHSQGSKGHHHKGHNDKGFKNVHHKIEYSVKKDYYTDNEDKHHHSNVDDFDKYFDKKRKQNLNDHEFYGKHLDDYYGLKGHHDKGHHQTHHKGHSKHYGHKGHHDHHHTGGHKDHHKKGHGHHHGHPHDHHGHHSHLSLDYLY